MAEIFFWNKEMIGKNGGMEGDPRQMYLGKIL